MEINQENYYQLKLVELAKEISHSESLIVGYNYEPSFNTCAHQFHVMEVGADDFLIYNTGFETAKSCYEWAVDECKKKGIIK